MWGTHSCWAFHFFARRDCLPPEAASMSFWWGILFLVFLVYLPDFVHAWLIPYTINQLINQYMRDSRATRSFCFVFSVTNASIFACPSFRSRAKGQVLTNLWVSIAAGRLSRPPRGDPRSLTVGGGERKRSETLDLRRVYDAPSRH